MSLSRDQLTNEIEKVKISSKNSSNTDLTKINYEQLENLDKTKIGRGTYAKVYKSTWKNETVAIKIMKNTVSLTYSECENEKDIHKYLSELKAPNIVGYCGYAIEKSKLGNFKYYIVMEYVPYSLNKHIIFDEQPFVWQARYKLINGMTRGISFLHQHQIVHRDIKSENILIDEEGNAKICDFGLSKYIDDKADAVGTPAWTAPEVFEHCVYTTAADVYSLATTIWQIAAWNLPFRSLNLYQTIANKMLGVTEKIPEDTPKGIASMINLGWMKKPEDRPSAAKILNVIEEEAKTLSLKLGKS